MMQMSILETCSPNSKYKQAEEDHEEASVQLDQEERGVGNFLCVRSVRVS